MGCGAQIIGGAVAALVGLAGAARSEETLPEFSACIDAEVARYEWRLRVHRDRALDAADFDLWDVRGVEYCGNIGVTRCDRSAAPLACQKALAGDQHVLHGHIMAALPDPPPPGEGQGLPTRLYHTAWHLARDISAGPDCAGAGEVMATWCTAREANLRLKSAVLAWQVGRYLGLAAPAVTTGWADPPPPPRPKARPGR
ncbi:MAG: hypothetical protein RID15_13455 [Marinovum algicola]|jgi:hypothetical protein|uniref:Uncharacterized protein n=1 Tax=Marinovum algicola TaxID=42444 RepID=A0A975WBI9_9RHOB|nr:hypothetical protein [Marinovum algicola]AKO97537.1 hypothetical protein MALG_02373 [Marinovum algicola DG 898]SEJ76985.1 hypothetical protein SAMN04487940_11066 [Marinovum algicola]SLN60248.1 hypothetical protein MAA5396_03181 [Marinovum algicola]